MLMSVNVGMPRDVSWEGKMVHTGAWKHPVSAAVMARRLNIDGDGQGDLAGHGGENRAVLVYQVQSYRHWKQHLGRDDLTYGQFGENLTVDGLPDDEVCIGDRYRIGEAEFEVTQPRVTCYRVGLRLGVPDMPSLLVSHHHPGFYMRVIREGRIQAGEQIIKTRTGPGPVTVADTNALLYLPHKDLAKLRLAVDIPALSPGWQGSFRELLQAASTAKPAAGTPEPGPAWAGFRQLLVTRVVRESESVASIYLASPDAVPLPAAEPGQYLTLRLPEAGQPAPVRSYSLSAEPGVGYYRISVKREPEGLISGYLNTKVTVGCVLEVAAPRGDFVLDDSDGAPVLLVSAGIGVTPLLAMLHWLASMHTQREVWWILGARGPREHPLAKEASELIATLPRASEHIFYSDATPPERFRMRAQPGRLSKDKLAALGVPACAAAYICGPNAFMTAMRTALTELGLAPSRIHSELFGARDRINPGITVAPARPPHQPPGPPGTGPVVTFSRSGISAPFPGSMGNVLELAEACDVPTRWSCRNGVCHTCVTRLLSGDVSYQPDPLELPADGQVLVCCARPAGDLVVDM
jgi:ferredoxin-NADP reductase/MOSC domain-containing protein YiiM